MPARLRIAAVALMLAGLTWLGVTAARYSVAGSASSNAAREIERMSRSQGNSGSWWTDDLARATRDAPGDPTAHELLGLGLAAQSNDPQVLESARKELLAAIALRPGSGYTWANLAALKYRLGETDAVFEKALVNAMRLAPFELEVQRDVADYGLAMLDEVEPATRAAIEQAVAAGMRRNAPEMLQIAARRGRLGAACRHLDGEPRPTASKWTQLCQSMEATS
jgi:hypothetical protein